MDSNNDFMTYWLKMDDLQSIVKKELEGVLQYEYHLSLKEFYVLYYLSIAPDKKLRLQELQKLILLSQSALSRIVTNMESSKCGALEKCICDDDRRGTYTRITDIGEQKLAGSLNIFREILSKHFASVDVEALMKKFVQSI